MTTYHNITFTERELILVSELIDRIEATIGASEPLIDGDMDTDFDTHAKKAIKAFKKTLNRSGLKV